MEFKWLEVIILSEKELGLVFTEDFQNIEDLDLDSDSTELTLGIMNTSILTPSVMEDYLQEDSIIVEDTKFVAMEAKMNLS
jgi:hypothetical protein